MVSSKRLRPSPFIRRFFPYTSRLLLIGLSAAGMAQAEEAVEWRCGTDASGESWSCSQESINRRETEFRKSDLVTKSNQITEALFVGTAAETDWVPEDKLSTEELEQVKTGCCGIYRAPERTDADANKDPEQSAIQASADQSQLEQQNRARLSGNVELLKGWLKLLTDEAELDQGTDVATLNGNILLRDPNMLLRGEHATMNMDSGEATVTDATYVLHNQGIRGAAGRIHRDEEQVLVLDNGALTRCEPSSNTWMLKASQLTINPNTHQGTGKHVRMNVHGVPVFYMPYLRFPVGDERLSGFLFPSISTSDNGGLDLTVPYYFNLAPNYDLILSPRYIDDRGEMLEAEARHLSTYFETKVSAAYLSNDKGGQDDDLDDLITAGSITEEEAYPFREEDRWLINVEQEGGRNARWFTDIDYTDVSDVDYFRDLDTPSLQVNASTYALQSGVAGYRSDHWTSSIRAEKHLPISDLVQTLYTQLPRVNIDGNYTLGDNWIVDLQHEYADFDHSDVDERQLITGERTRLNYSLTWNGQWQWGFFKPKAAVKTLSYRFDDEYLRDGFDDSQDYVVPQGSLDTGLYFERDTNLFGNSFLQTLEPRLFYFYSDYENQDDLIRLTTSNNSVDFDSADLTFSYSQLFRDTRFSGGDRLDDDNRVSVGLTSRFLDPQTGVENFSASIGQIFYFEDRRVTLLTPSDSAITNTDNNRTESELAAEVYARLGDHWQWRSSITWDERDSDRVGRGSTSLSYRGDEGSVLNLGYRFTRDDPVRDYYDADGDGDTYDEIPYTIEQGDVSFSMPVFGNWNLLGRYYYDFTFKRELETLAGVEYNSCCYAARIVWRRWLDNDLVSIIDSLDLEEDKGWFVEFQFKSLGSVGRKIKDILFESIPGYQDPDAM